MTGHLNSFSASGGGEFEQNFSKNSNARGVAGGMFKLRFDWYIRTRQITLHVICINFQGVFFEDNFREFGTPNAV